MAAWNIVFLPVIENKRYEINTKPFYLPLGTPSILILYFITYLCLYKTILYPFLHVLKIIFLSVIKMRVMEYVESRLQIQQFFIRILSVSLYGFTDGCFEDGLLTCIYTYLLVTFARI